MINKNRVIKILNEIDPKVTVVCASKYYEVEEIRILYDCGIRNFGENKVNSLLEKYEALKDLNIKWHMIGHLQRNKAKLILDKIDYLHSLDSLDLAKILNSNNKKIKVFVEVNINEEETKCGLNENEVLDFFKNIKEYKKLELLGLMTMGRKDDNALLNEETFSKLYSLLNVLNHELNLNMKDLSMGMSNDYKIAISNHSTFIRLGRIFKDE